MSGLIWLFGDAIVWELLMKIKSLFVKTNKPDLQKYNGYLPICYHPDYNITACGLEKCHPFDSVKYGRINRFLTDLGVLSP